jgi:hypothetical protein
MRAAGTATTALARTAAVFRRRRAGLKAFDATEAVLPRWLGVREIPVAQIVGSVGRWRDLRADFRPRRSPSADEERYRLVRAAVQRYEPLPPILVHRVGKEYFVLDGHHRVAAARALGRVYIDAEVTEYRPPRRGGPDSPADGVSDRARTAGKRGRPESDAARTPLGALARRVTRV